MSLLRLTLACGLYDRTLPLYDGRVLVPGIRLNYLHMRPDELFWRALRFQEFDANELSMCNHIMLTARGASPFVGIPAFVSRLFRHSTIVVNAHSGIKEPGDLAGKRVGAPHYHLTALLWIRGMLQHDYGVKASDMHWVFAGLHGPNRQDRMDFQMPPGISWEEQPERTLSDMVERGEIDAVFGPELPRSFIEGSPNVTRLFPDYVSVERDYYRRTGLFPIMHTVAIRRDVYEAHPWVARNLYEAFARAREIAMREMWESGFLRYAIPHLIPMLEEHREWFGEDWWPYGVESNRHILEVMTQYAYEQGLTERKVEIAELFAPSTLVER